MKAMMIDATARQIRELEVDPLNLKEPFKGSKSFVPVEIATARISVNGITLVYDRNAVLKHPADYFYVEGLSGPVYGKGLLLGKAGIDFRDIELNALGTEAIVAFHGKKCKTK